MEVVFPEQVSKVLCIAIIDPTHKDEIEKELTKRYLAEFPEYEKTFKMYFVKPDDGARFV